MLTDLKYLGMIRGRLRNYTKKSSRLFNCSCPICGDGKDKRKARGYFMPRKKGTGLYYFCHKCNVAMTFSNFLKQIDEQIYKEYRDERIKSKYGHVSKKKEITPPRTNTKQRLSEAKKKYKVTDCLKNMAEMPKHCREYLLSRKIDPEHLWKYFFYTDDFKSFANDFCPGTFEKKAMKYKESRIIILFYDDQNNISAIQGRELKKSYAKYVTIKASEESRKVFGLDRIDKRQPVYVLEGPIDSLFIDNAIGVAGADLVSQVSGLNIKPVFVFDNEPRSPIIVKKIERAIEQGLKVVIFPPSDTSSKDINDMVKGNVEVNRLLKERTFSGLQAKIEFQQWKRTNN